MPEEITWSPLTDSLHFSALAIGSSQENKGQDITADTNGNIYVTGNFKGSADFGSVNMSAVTTDVYIVKYNAQGNMLWAVQGASTAFASGMGIALDDLGNVYITGSFHGVLNFSGHVLTSSGCSDIFVLKLNSSGAFQWLKQAGGADCDYGQSIAVSGASVYVTGSFKVSATFGGSDISSSGSNYFLTKLSTTDGSFQWVRQANGASDGIGYSIAADISGNVYTTGNFKGNASFGPFSLSSIASTGELFFTKYDASGNVLWAEKGSSTYAAGNSIVVDDQGNLYLAGVFRSSLNVKGQSLTSSPAGADNGFVLKIDNLGNVSWIKQISSDLVFINDMSLDASSNVAFIGTFFGSGSINIGGTSVPSSGDFFEVYSGAFSSDGQLNWAYTAGETGIDSDYGYGISFSGSSGICMTGSFEGTIRFGSTVLSTTSINTFVAYADIIPENTGPGCSENLVLSSVITSSQKANRTITTSGVNTIQPSSNVTYQAGNYVQLNPGFSTGTNSVFMTKLLAGCQ